jgi:hypothetical protein
MAFRLTLYLHNIDDISSSIHDTLQLVCQELHIFLPIHYHLLSPRRDIDLRLQLHVSEIVNHRNSLRRSVQSPRDPRQT